MPPSRPRPSPARAALRVLLLTVPALAVLAATTLAFAPGLAWLGGTAVFSTAGLLNALACGLTSWLFAAIFHLRTETVALEVTDGPTFLRRLRSDLVEFGYHATRVGAWTYLFTPDFFALRFGGRIRAHASAGVARVTAPGKLLQRLRGRSACTPSPPAPGRPRTWPAGAAAGTCCGASTSASASTRGKARGCRPRWSRRSPG